MARVLVIATANAGKFREFVDLLGDLPVELRSLAEFPDVPPLVETEVTYAGNAVRKALTVARATGHAALADDSGLEVDVLGGAPGVHSARYAGPGQDSAANVAKLLAALAGVPSERRTAHFRCVLAVATPDGGVLTAEGTCDGRILEARRGSGGFGYDPVFLDIESGLTFAELPVAAKHRVSHRGRAVAALRRDLAGFLAAHAGAAGVA